jgi:hypothetical protein
MAEEQPPLPFYDWDACPFECCTYREWTLSYPVSFHQTHAKESPVVFRLEEGQTVQAVTGVVVTAKCGTATVLKSLEGFGIAKDGVSPPLALKPGQTLCTLHYEGEGSSLFWYGGKLYSGEVSNDSFGEPPESGNFRTDSSPEASWWVMVRSPTACNGVSCRAGEVGWSNETSAFKHKDSCE